MVVAMTNTPTSDEFERFQVWSREQARGLRHLAAARGWPAEYAFLRRRDQIEALLRRDFPGLLHMLDCVESDCCRGDIQLDIAEINRIREDDGRPPLDFIPEVEDRPRFPPPKPKQPRTKDEEMELFHVWMVKKVSDAYHSAAARRTSAREEMFAVPSFLVGDIMRRFPALNPAWCLEQLDTGLMFYRPEKLDPERVKNLKAWSDTFKEAGDQIEGRVAAASKPPIKQ
jgi:hypothetical protein